MNKLYRKALLPALFWLCGSAALMAQTSISGTVKDGTTGDPLAGVNIVVKGRVIGTISNTSGQYSLKVNQEPPFTLVFSFIGFSTQEIEIKDANTTLDVSLEEQTLLGQEVVVSASRVEESILKSPVTVEKMDLLAIKQSATPDFYDALSNVKGVQTNSGSLNLTSINTRGFATIANVRFVQLVDGMVTQAPLLNFPTGNIIGIGELDAESVELVPGAASALYGPNAFNGILIMKSHNNIQWVHTNDICANDYNPNVVMNDELNLLKLSLLKTGWIQPVLLNKNSAQLSGAKKIGSFSVDSSEQTHQEQIAKQPETEMQKPYVLIDGFHRYFLSHTDKHVTEVFKQYVPAIIFDMLPAECMLLTVRINRAKGVHVAVKMHDLVSIVFHQYGYTKMEIAKQIGADIAEIDTLAVIY